MSAEKLPQALALLGTRVWVCHDMIRELRVQSSSDRSVSFVEYILLYTGVDSGSFRLLSFSNQSWGYDP